MAAPPPAAPAPAPVAAAPPAAPPAAAPVAGPVVPVANPGSFVCLPPWVEYKLPTKSRADELVQLRVKNPTGERVVFKVDVTQPRKFIVMPKTGFIEPMCNSAVIELQPKNIAQGELTSYQDKFYISIAAATPEATIADDVWKAAVVKNIVHADIKIIP